MATWHPPIPASKLYSGPALKLGPALAMLIWCYDGIQRDGTIEIRLESVQQELGVSYRTIKDWWKLLKEGPFFCEQIDRGRRGWVVRMADNWIDWHVMRNNYPEGQNSALDEEKEQPSRPAQGQETTPKEAQGPVKAPSRPGEGRNSALEGSAYKVLHDDHESGDLAPRAKAQRRPPKEDTTPAEIREALARECGIDLAVCSREQAINVNRTAARLYQNGKKAGKAPTEIADTIHYVARWYRKNDWRGKKGDRPTPKVLVDVWGAAIAARSPPTTNGHKPINTIPADAHSTDETARRLLALRKQQRE